MSVEVMEKTWLGAIKIEISRMKHKLFLALADVSLPFVVALALLGLVQLHSKASPYMAVHE